MSSLNAWVGSRRSARRRPDTGERGLFAGVTFKGSSIRADVDANERFYGETLDTRAVTVEGRAGPGTAPEAEAAQRWHAILKTYGP
jgi:hypothetical protein